MSDFTSIFHLLKMCKQHHDQTCQQIKREKNFQSGNQDLLDIISYSALKEHSSYLQLDNSYIRTLFISAYPFVASTGWLSMLIHFNHNIDISIHIEQVDSQFALPKLTRKITELESTKRSLLLSGRIIGSEITDPLTSAMNLRDKILRGQEKLFQISTYMGICAPSLAELNRIATLLETVLSTRLFYSKNAIFQQLEGLQSFLPRGQNLLGIRRNLDSSSTALTFPFISSEFVQDSGILYGINKSNNSLVIIDRFLLNNANAIIFAQSGSGKSYTAKVEILRQLMQGTKVIVIDPEREYRQLSNSVHGSFIRMAISSSERINPFEFSFRTHEENMQLVEHIQNLTQIIALMVSGLTKEESAVLDKAIIKTYKNKGFIFSKKQKTNQKQEFPILKDLYTTLVAMKQNSLCKRLDRYVHGSLASVFNTQTTIELNNRLVVFDIKELEEPLRQIMMLIIAQYVQAQMKEKLQRRLLVIDEGWLLLNHPESAQFLSNLVRRSRKYYLGITIISQQASDFLKHEYGKTIASQASLRILMRQDTTTIKEVCQEFRLSEYEQHFLLTCDRGEALVIADQNHVAVSIVASQKEHPLLTTDPRELYI